MTANDRKSYVGYWTKLGNEYSNSYHRYIGKKLFDADYSASTEKTESNHEAHKVKEYINELLYRTRHLL